MTLHSARSLWVLIADDDPALRKLVAEVLLQAGFLVLLASDGRNALAVARKHDGPIDLLITDVMMPKLDGFDLRERLLQERIGVRTLVMSGQFDSGMYGEDFAIIRKPFAPEELLQKVRRVLATPGSHATL